MDKQLKDIELSGGFEWTPGSPWPPYVGAGNTANEDSPLKDALNNYDIPHSDAWYDYTRNDPDRENPFTDPKDRESTNYVNQSTSTNDFFNTTIIECFTNDVTPVN